MKYKIVYLANAEYDLMDLFNAICFDYKSPILAERYIQGLKDTIQSLAKNAESYVVQVRRSLLQYGINVRRINYKRMAIIYTVHEDVVYIQRIIPASMITGI
jgi:plasmid stabilization system protein ParE